MISICIPTYEMKGLGDSFLSFSFDILCNQTYKDFNVIISDDSSTDLIKNVCDRYNDKLNIKYIRNENNNGKSSSNINNAILNADGEIIKILFQDDFLKNENSLMEIYNEFDLEKDFWLVSACDHMYNNKNVIQPHFPMYQDMIHVSNSIGCPSVLSIKNVNNKIYFDENLIWLMDCDYYKRCFNNFGLPKILNSINATIRIGDHQVSQTQCNQELQKREHEYVKNKHNEICY